VVAVTEHPTFVRPLGRSQRPARNFPVTDTVTTLRKRSSKPSIACIGQNGFIPLGSLRELRVHAPDSPTSDFRSWPSHREHSEGPTFLWIFSSSSLTAYSLHLCGFFYTQMALHDDDRGAISESADDLR
jgi:hypothetical protein